MYTAGSLLLLLLLPSVSDTFEIIEIDERRSRSRSRIESESVHSDMRFAVSSPFQGYVNSQFVTMGATVHSKKPRMSNLRLLQLAAGPRHVESATHTVISGGLNEPSGNSTSNMPDINLPEASRKRSRKSLQSALYSSAASFVDE